MCRIVAVTSRQDGFKRFAPRKTSQLFIALSLLGLGLGSPTMPTHGQGKNRAKAPNLSTPQKTIETFLIAIKQRDMAAAAKCVLHGIPREFPGAQITLKYAHYEVSSDHATLTTACSLHETTDPYPFKERLKFKKDGEDWKLVPPAKEANGCLSQFLILLGKPEVPLKSLETTCVSNLRQISKASQNFLNDYDGTFALKAETYKQSLSPYSISDRIYHCPLDKAGIDSYTFNSYLVQLKVNGVKDPANTVMFYEGKDGRLDFRHEGKAGVVMADGRVKMITIEEAKSVIWKPSIPYENHPS